MSIYWRSEDLAPTQADPGAIPIISAAFLITASKPRLYEVRLISDCPWVRTVLSALLPDSPGTWKNSTWSRWRLRTVLSSETSTGARRCRRSLQSFGTCRKWHDVYFWQTLRWIHPSPVPAFQTDCRERPSHENQLEHTCCTELVAADNSDLLVLIWRRRLQWELLSLHISLGDWHRCLWYPWPKIRKWFLRLSTNRHWQL